MKTNEISQWVSKLPDKYLRMFNDSAIELAFSIANSVPGEIIQLHSNHLVKKIGNGFVTWRGKIIESFMCTDASEDPNLTAFLTMRCLAAEGKGFPIHSRTISNMEPLWDAPKGTPWLKAMMHFYAVFSENGIAKYMILSLPNGAVCFHKRGGTIYMDYMEDTSENFGARLLYSRFLNQGFKALWSEINAYNGFVHAMNQAKIEPDDVETVIRRAI